jgi:hypothetical protein
MQEVRGSIPLSSTPRALGESLVLVGATLGGFIAGEGSFFVTRRLPPFQDGGPRQRFVFQVSVAARDRNVLEALRAFLGTGSIHDRARRYTSWLPVSTFTIGSHRAHRQVTIPFAERFLLLGAKRRQFESWRDDLHEYERLHPPKWGRGRSACSEAGCHEPVRGRGLCRRHYYRATGW